MNTDREKEIRRLMYEKSIIIKQQKKELIKLKEELRVLQNRDVNPYYSGLKRKKKRK